MLIVLEAEENGRRVRPGDCQPPHKYIKNSLRYGTTKAASRWQQKTPGLQGNNLSNRKRGKREDGDLKRGKTEKFWAGPVASKEGGSPETGGVPMHREAPLQVGPRGRCGVSKTRQSRQRLRGQRTEKATLLSPLTAHRLWPQLDVGSGNWEWEDTNLTSTYNPSGTEGGPE